MERVVVTGVGILSPIGKTFDIFWDSLIKGVNGIREINSFDTSLFRTHFGGEILNFQPGEYITRLKIENIGRASQLAIAAAKMAIKQSGLDFNKLNPGKIGVSLGTTSGEPQVIEEIDEAWVHKGMDHIPVNLIYQYPCGMIPANLANELEIKGPNIIIPTACASGNYAIGYALNLLQAGKADVIFAGGVDAFSKMAFAGFNRLFSIAPEKCQPFDKNRKGMIVSEGVGILLLETLSHARKRNAHILAEIISYGLSCSCYHMNRPHPQGIGAIHAMHKAFKAGKVSVNDIDYINAHGTGTPANDAAETIAYKEVFKDLAYDIPISSIKSMIGHTMGAASAIEAISCIGTINNGIIPPTINYEEKDPLCDLDYVPNKAREKKVNYAISNAYAFGANDSTLLISKFNEK